MKAVITGAGSGLGREFAKQLDSMGYETVLVGRREDKLRQTGEMLKNAYIVYTADLGVKENCIKLFNDFPDADVLINNAGFGSFGAIAESDLSRDIAMIDINVTAQYILQKLYLEAFLEKGKGYILNTASSAAFMAGPFFGLYYATKSFVFRISEAASREVKGTGVYVSAFCPGSVDTEFNSVAKTISSTKPLSAEYAAGYALKQLFKGKSIIIPSFKIKAAFVCSKLMPEKWLTEFSYNVQKKRFTK